MFDASVIERPTDVITATEPEQRQHALQALILAFAADPPSRWVFPREADDCRFFPGFAGGIWQD